MKYISFYSLFISYANILMMASTETGAYTMMGSIRDAFWIISGDDNNFFIF